jgi:hypothetical protein
MCTKEQIGLFLLSASKYLENTLLWWQQWVGTILFKPET